jgi:hypothetical protein
LEFVLLGCQLRHCGRSERGEGVDADLLLDYALFQLGIVGFQPGDLRVTWIGDVTLRASATPWRLA